MSLKQLLGCQDLGAKKIIEHNQSQFVVLESDWLNVLFELVCQANK